MNAQVIGTLVAKDLSLFFRNRFFTLISGLGLVFYIAMYFFLPNQVDETLELALYAPDIPIDLLEEMEEDGLEFLDMDSEEALKEVVMTGDYGVGVALPENLIQRTAGSARLLYTRYTGRISRNIYDLGSRTGLYD